MKTDKPEHHHHHSLLSWLTHIKHHHDKDPVSPASKPEEEDSPSPPPPPPDIFVNNEKQAPSSDESVDDSSIHSKAPSSIFRHFHRDNYLFHRPHGLLHHANRRLSSAASTNDADDELEIDDNDDRSKDGTTRPYLHENDSSISRQSSVFALPDDIDSPTVGFKKLKRDGNLIDWDESDIIHEESEDDDTEETSIDTSKTYLRSVIRNDLIQLALNGPFQSPLHPNSKKHVLHIGCGDGSWCIETALMFPNWLVVGMDDKTGGFSPDQRKVPKNFKYIRNYFDILKTIRDLPSDSFDLVYSRFLIDVYGDDKYMEFIKECKRICKPKGYVELYELDMRIYGNPKAGAATHKLNATVFRSMEENGLNPRLARKLGDMVSEVFQEHKHEPQDSDTQHELEKKKKHFDTNYTSLPLGIWGGRLGVIFRDSITDLFFEYNNNGDLDSLQSNEGSISSQSDGIPYNKDVETMIKEMESQKAFMNLHHVYARK